MKRIAGAAVCVFALGSSAPAADPPTEADQNWPQWRGPAATGVAPHGDPPIEWSETKNIRWKVAVPGQGHATPIVWGDRVYIQTALETDKKGEVAESTEPPPPERRSRRGRGRRGGRGWMGSRKPTNIHKFSVLALDRANGKVVWETTVAEELPHEGGHRDGTLASNSPVTDGEHIFAFFGSRGLFCLDMQGKLIWEKNFGKMRTRMGFGEGSSPVVFGDTVVVTWDHEGDSFIVALDKNTGEQRWKVDRDEHTSWATPIVVEADGKPQVVASASNLIRSYDLATGKEVWQCGGMTSNVIPTPVAGNGLLYAISGFRGNALQAIRYAKAKGDITGSPTIAWEYTGKGTPYVPSPLLYGDLLYFLDSNRAILSCFNAKTGEKLYDKQRLEDMQRVYASPVGASDRVYIAGRDGTTVVLKHSAEFSLLATNKLDDGFDASPAIVGSEIFLRGRSNLYCIAKD